MRFLLFLLSPAVLFSYKIVSSTMIGGDFVRSLSVEDKIFEVTHRGVVLIDVENPEKPHIIRKWATPGLAWDVQVFGDYVFILDDQEGILTYGFEKTDRLASYSYDRGKVLVSVPPYVYAGGGTGELQVLEIQENGELKKRWSIPHPEPIKDIQIEHQGLYIQVGEFQLYRYAFTERGEPRLETSLTFPEEINKFIVADTSIIYGTPEGALNIGRFSPPFIESIQRKEFGSPISSITLHGSFLYVGTEDGRLYVMEYPTLNIVKETQLIGLINDIVSVSKYVFVSLGKAGMMVLNFENLEEVASLGGVGNLTSLGILREDVIYLLDPLLGIRLISFFSPEMPETRGEFSLPGEFKKLTQVDNSLVAGVVEGGFWTLQNTPPYSFETFYPLEGKLVDILSLENDVLLGVAGSGVYRLKRIKGTWENVFFVPVKEPFFKLKKIENGFVIILRGATVFYDNEGKKVKAMERTIIDIEESSRGIIFADVFGNIGILGERGEKIIAEEVPPVYDIEIAGDRIFIAKGKKGIVSLSLEDGRTLFQVKPPGPVTGLVSKHPYIFAYGQEDRVFVYEVSGVFPKELPFIRTKAPVKSIVLRENWMFIAEKGGGEIYSLFRFEEPSEVGLFLSEGELYAGIPSSRGDILYVACGSQGLQGIDFRNVYQPKRFLKEIPRSGTNYDVTLMDKYLITADIEFGGRVYEVINPFVLRAFKELKGNLISLGVLKNAFLLTGDQNGILRVIDTRQGSFSLVSTLNELPTAVLDITTYKNVAYLAMGDEGIYIVNLRFPTRPVIQRKFSVPYTVYRLKQFDDILVAILGPYGLGFFEIQDNGDLKLLEYVDTPGRAQDVIKYGGFYLVADTYSIEVIQ